jgi:hypothetical protein
MGPTSRPFIKLFGQRVDDPPQAATVSPPFEEERGLIGALQILLQGSRPDEGLVPPLKAFIADEQRKIFEIHRQGGSGREVVEAITDLTDAVVTSSTRGCGL